MKKSVLKASFAKKAGAVVLSCVLLCGQGMSAAAATSFEAIQKGSIHEHVFYVYEWHLIGFTPYRHHDYVDSEGKKQSCAIWTHIYSGELVCACGATNGFMTQTEHVHLNCGQ